MLKNNEIIKQVATLKSRKKEVIVLLSALDDDDEIFQKIWEEHIL